MVRDSCQGFRIRIGETIDEQELLDELDDFENEYNIKDYFYAISTIMLRYGDAAFLTGFDDNVGLTEFRSLPMEYLTAVETRDQIGDALAQIFERNIYLLNEGTDKVKEFPGDEVVVFPLNNIGSTVKDLMRRYTYGIWSQSPVEPLRAVLLWKLSLKINDMLLRNHLVPRQHHKINLEGFVPQNYPGDTLEDRYAAAKAAAEKYINEYKTNVASPLKEVDKSIITGQDIEIGYVEPLRVRYIDPNPLITEINKSIWASIAPIEAAVTASGTRSYAAELVISSYSELIASTIADIIKMYFLEVTKEHIRRKFDHKYDDQLKKIELKTQLIMGIQRGELIRQGAVMSASGALTPDEFRDLIGFDPMTDDQRAEMIWRSMGPGRVGQFDRTTGDIISDYIRRTDSDSRNPVTPESRRDQQTT